jgi:hypothetical protein
VGTITPKKPVYPEVAETLIETAQEALRLYFSPANFPIGRKPTIMDIVEVIERCDKDIRHFDPGSPKSFGIEYYSCDIEYFNPISFARYLQPDTTSTNIRINPAYIIE